MVTDTAQNCLQGCIPPCVGVCLSPPLTSQGWKRQGTTCQRVQTEPETAAAPCSISDLASHTHVTLSLAANTWLALKMMLPGNLQISLRNDSQPTYNTFYNLVKIVKH